MNRTSTLLLLLLAAPSAAYAQTPAEPPAPAAAPRQPSDPTETGSGEHPKAPSSETPAPGTSTRAAPSAVAAIDRAAAAYEYGDMKEVVESARPVVDGAIEASEAERLQALRLLGIALYLTGRPTGAEGAFLELLRYRPKARLDPTTTRPEVVAFFEDVRRRHRAEIEDAYQSRSRKSLLWNFLPPIGQFKNGDPGRGALILGAGMVSAATAVTSYVLLDKWRGPGNTFGSHTEASAVRTLNWISVGVLAATYVGGVIDAFARSDREPEGAERVVVGFFPLPGGVGLGGRF